MNWSGVWRNQYGSMLEVTGERDGVVEGWFTSAIDGGIQGIKARVTGACLGDQITFCAAAGSIVAAWTGLLRDGRLETLWQVAASERFVAKREGEPAVRRTLGVFEAFTTGADTFVRVEA